MDVLHRQKQREIINAIEKQATSNSLTFSTISKTKNYDADPRICLTSVHFPNSELINAIHKTLIEPLKNIAPKCYFYSLDSLHLTIKNIQVISDPPTFSNEDIQKAKEIFSKVIPGHKKFSIYFDRLILFPNNLSLIATTDPQLDEIIHDLNVELNKAKIPDNKKYLNSDHFFCNITLLRMNEKPSPRFVDKVKELSQNLKLPNYSIDSVTLLSANAALKRRKIHGEWRLQ